MRNGCDKTSLEEERREEERRRGSCATRLATTGAVIIGTSFYVGWSSHWHVPSGRATAEGGRDRREGELGSCELEAAPSPERRQHWARLEIRDAGVPTPQST